MYVQYVWMLCMYISNCCFILVGIKQSSSSEKWQLDYILVDWERQLIFSAQLLEQKKKTKMHLLHTISRDDMVYTQSNSATELIYSIYTIIYKTQVKSRQKLRTRAAKKEKEETLNAMILRIYIALAHCRPPSCRPRTRTYLPIS